MYLYINMEVIILQKIFKYTDLDKIKPLFNDIRFYMGKSVLDGVMGEAYVDNILSPKIDKNFNNYTLIPSDNLKKEVENIYQNNIIKSQRYSIKKEEFICITDDYENNVIG